MRIRRLRRCSLLTLSIFSSFFADLRSIRRLQETGSWSTYRRWTSRRRQSSCFTSRWVSLRGLVRLADLSFLPTFFPFLPSQVTCGLLKLSIDQNFIISST